MTRANHRTAHRAGALGAAATLVASMAVAFLSLGSGSADAATAMPSAAVPTVVLAAPVAGIHGPYTTTTDECASCHRVHTGKDANLLKSPVPQSNLCFTCHDGTGGPDVLVQYTSAPANNVTTRDVYSHDARVTTSHTLATDATEFQGVLNRHSECADCHNPHQANPTAGTQTATGWTPSGRLAGISGVSVSNGPTVITPTFLDGTTTPINREYQLCFKCHSGFTTLTSNTGFAPSKWRLDKAAEFNPANLSYHPVEAPGTNTTAKMAASLAGASPYKLSESFTTGSTIRCSNCHTSSIKYPVTPPAAGGDLPTHTSQYRGILLRNYQDRELKSATAPYADADFALCYLCHTNSPFNGSGDTTATNFSLHGLHVTGIAGRGSGGTDLSIDTAGAGQGNAICAECHFRLHSTAYGTPSGSRLVNFAPNVQPNGLATPSWTSTGTGSGSCSLTCHGHAHNRSYSP
jgi:predicted CXXCH cytochrome family protein